MSFNISSSTKVQQRNMKILLWGATGARKTEWPLRNLPHCLLIDVEGNGDACIGVEEIPEFMRVVTKDPYEVVDVLEQVTAGKIKFPDGSPIETVILDSITVLYAVRQDAGALRAEARGKRYNKSADDSTLTQLDWGIIKRPLKRINTLIAGAPIKYLVMISREKDKTEEKTVNGSKEFIKVGFMPDAMKGTEYEVNLGLHFGFDSNNKWFAEVSKTQGALNKIFPKDKKFFELDATELIKYSEKVNTKSTSKVADEQEAVIANAAKDQEMMDNAPVGHTFKDLMVYAEKELGMDEATAREILKTAGHTKYREENFEDFKVVIGASRNNGSIAA